MLLAGGVSGTSIRWISALLSLCLLAKYSNYQYECSCFLFLGAFFLHELWMLSEFVGGRLLRISLREDAGVGQVSCNKLFFFFLLVSAMG